MKNLGVTALMTIIALVPAVLIYSLFPDNSANVTFGGQAVRLGGPIAAFAGLFILMSGFYRKLELKNADLAEVMRQKFRPIEGIWDFESVSTGASKDKRYAAFEIKGVDAAIELTGGGFAKTPGATAASEIVGAWNCDFASFDGHRLLFIYELQAAKVGAVGQEKWRGLVDAQLVAGANPPCFTGTWETFGEKYHSGLITLTKRQAPA